MKFPDTINILGTPYKVLYQDNPSDVDIFKRESLWGQIDYWTCTIRIYKNNLPLIEIWKNIFHEMLHGLGQDGNITMLKNKDNHSELNFLAGALVDTLVRNGWMNVED